jgi:hypothetical protein
MQKQQVLTRNAEEAGATLYCKRSRRYTVMQREQAIHNNAEVAGATL